MTSSLPAYLLSFVPRTRPASARFGKGPSMRLRFSVDQLAKRTYAAHRLGGFHIFAKAWREHSSSIRPPGLNARPMIVNANVAVPPLPLLRIQRALALLKPGVLEEVESCEKQRYRAHPIFLVRAVPVFHRRGE